MKKLLVTIFLTAIFILTVFSVANSKAKYKQGEKLRINTSKTYFRSKPKPFGVKILKILERGTTISYVSRNGSWLKVNYDGEEGFIPQNSLIKAKKFKSFSKTAKVTQSDMAAASKGFSPEVENKNRENKKLRYDLMDDAEIQSAVENPLEALTSFRQKGKLGEFQKQKLIQATE